MNLHYKKLPGSLYQSTKWIEYIGPKIPRKLLTEKKAVYIIAKTSYATLWSTGHLLINEYNNWNGISFPGMTNRLTIKGSHYHDNMYRLIEDGYLGVDDSTRDAWRKYADKGFMKVLRTKNDQGERISWFLARAMYRTVRLAGGSHADPLSKLDINKTYKA